MEKVEGSSPSWSTQKRVKVSLKYLDVRHGGLVSYPLFAKYAVTCEKGHKVAGRKCLVRRLTQKCDILVHSPQ